MPDVHPAAVGAPEGIDSEKREQEELLDALKRATIGEYDIYSPLGRGGMATVFLALELALNRRVAIKVISPSALSSTTVIERFWLEARTAASLSHPHVIPIYAVRSVAGLHFFVMKHVQGGSLDVVLKSEGPFAFSLARTILSQVSHALAYAHRRGVIHRDIKPANIMLDDDGYAIVMDFGIAKVRDVAALTASGAMVGTPYYMSPEQFSGDKVDGRSDQYALGVVAFELITGRRPFKGDSVPAILRGHLLDKPPDIRELRKDCPTSLATLVNRMLCKSPDDRFPSMEAICTELDGMPRINTDQVREKIVSLAKTASISSPRINEPLSPLPISRTSEQLKATPKPVIEPKSGSNVVLRFVRRRPWVSVAAMVMPAAATAAVFQFSHREIQPPVFRVPAATTTRGPLLANPPVVEAATGFERSDTGIATARSDSTRKKISEAELKVPAIIDSPGRSKIEDSRQPRKKEIEKIAVPIVRNAPTPPPAEPPDNAESLVVAVPLTKPKPPTAFNVGSRLPGAVFYVDNVLMGIRSGRTTFPHNPGVVHLQIKAEDCMTFDTVFVLLEGDTAQIGWRNPKCGK